MNKFRSVFFLSFLCVGSQVGFSSDDQVAQLSGADVATNRVTTSLNYTFRGFPDFSVRFKLTRPQIDGWSTDNDRIQAVCIGIEELFEERYVREVTADEQLKKNFIIQKMFASNPEPEQLTKSLLQLEQEYKVLLSQKRARDITDISATTYKNIFNHEIPDELKQALKMMSSYRFEEWQHQWLEAARSARDEYKTNHDGAVPPAAWLQRMERSTLTEACVEREKQAWIYEAMERYPHISRANGQAYQELAPEWKNTLQRMDGMDTKDAKAEVFKIIEAREQRRKLAILASRKDHNKSDIY